MTPLYAFWHRVAGRPFQWGGFGGGTDCCLYLGEWIEIVQGANPLAPVVMAYDGPASCQRATGFFRDPVAAAARFFEGDGGIARTNDPAPGDVGVAMALTSAGPTPVGVLRLRDAWGFKTADGAGTAQAVDLLAAWAVGYRE